VHVAEAVIERVVIRVAVDADDRDAADAGFADLPEGRVDDEEPRSVFCIPAATLTTRADSVALWDIGNSSRE
jgi:hypothetical protein